MMKQVFNFAASFFLSAIFASNSFATTKPFPDMLCVDAEYYWDGPYTIEVNQLNENGQAMVEIYDQSPEGRFVVAKVQVETQTTDAELLLTGEHFELTMSLTDQKKPTRAHVRFSNEYGVLDQDYMCLFY